MTFSEFVVSKIFGPIMTNLICMPYYSPWFEDLSDVQSFDLSHARNLRIPVLNNAQNAAESVIFSIILRLIASNLYTQWLIQSFCFMLLKFICTIEKDGGNWSLVFKTTHGKNHARNERIRRQFSRYVILYI